MADKWDKYAVSEGSTATNDKWSKYAVEQPQFNTGNRGKPTKPNAPGGGEPYALEKAAKAYSEMLPPGNWPEMVMDPANTAAQLWEGAKNHIPSGVSHVVNNLADYGNAWIHGGDIVRPSVGLLPIVGPTAQQVYDEVKSGKLQEAFGHTAGYATQLASMLFDPTKKDPTMVFKAPRGLLQDAADTAVANKNFVQGFGRYMKETPPSKTGAKIGALGGLILSGGPSPRDLLKLADVYRAAEFGGGGSILGGLLPNVPGAIRRGMGAALDLREPSVPVPGEPFTPFKPSKATASKMPFTQGSEPSGMPRTTSAAPAREPAFGPDVSLRPTPGETPAATIPGGKFEVKPGLMRRLKARSGGAGDSPGMPRSTGGRDISRRMPPKPTMTSPAEAGVEEGSITLNPDMAKAFVDEQAKAAAARTAAEKATPNIKVPVKGSSRHAERLAKFVAEQAEKGDLKDNTLKGIIEKDKPGITASQWRALPDAVREKYITGAGFAKPAKAGSKGLSRDLATITEDIASLLPD